MYWFRVVTVLEEGCYFLMGSLISGRLHGVRGSGSQVGWLELREGQGHGFVDEVRLIKQDIP